MEYIYYNYHKRTTTRTKTRPDSKQEMVTWRNEVYHYTYIIHILSSNIPLLAFHKVRYHLSFWIINGIGFRYWVKEGNNNWYTSIWFGFWTIVLMVYFCIVYIFKLLAFFSDMGLSRMEIMPSMSKSARLLTSSYGPAKYSTS